MTGPGGPGHRQWQSGLSLPSHCRVSQVEASTSGCLYARHASTPAMPLRPSCSSRLRTGVSPQAEKRTLLHHRGAIAVVQLMLGLVCSPSLTDVSARLSTAPVPPRLPERRFVQYDNTRLFGVRRTPPAGQRAFACRLAASGRGHVRWERRNPSSSLPSDLWNL